jgi:hypothetical protein
MGIVRLNVLCLAELVRSLYVSFLSLLSLLCRLYHISYVLCRLGDISYVGFLISVRRYKVLVHVPSVGWVMRVCISPVTVRVVLPFKGY